MNFAKAFPTAAVTCTIACAECVKRILKLSGNLKDYQTLTDNHGYTILHEAARRGMADCIKLILEKKVQ